MAPLSNCDGSISVIASGWTIGIFRNTKGNGQMGLTTLNPTGTTSPATSTVLMPATLSNSEPFSPPPPPEFNKYCVSGGLGQEAKTDMTGAVVALPVLSA